MCNENQCEISIAWHWNLFGRSIWNTTDISETSLYCHHLKSLQQLNAMKSSHMINHTGLCYNSWHSGDCHYHHHQRLMPPSLTAFIWQKNLRFYKNNKIAIKPEKYHSPIQRIQTHGLGLSNRGSVAIIGQDDCPIFHFPIYFHSFKIWCHSVSNVQIAAQPIKCYSVWCSNNTRVSISEKFCFVSTSIWAYINCALQTRQILPLVVVWVLLLWSFVGFYPKLW